MPYRTHSPAVCRCATCAEERCRSVPREAQQPHPGPQQREGCWGEESAGEREEVQAVCPGLVQRDQQALLKNPCAVNVSLWA